MTNILLSRSLFDNSHQPPTSMLSPYWGGEKTRATPDDADDVDAARTKSKIDCDCAPSKPLGTSSRERASEAENCDDGDDDDDDDGNVESWQWVCHPLPHDGWRVTDTSKSLLTASSSSITT